MSDGIAVPPGVTLVENPPLDDDGLDGWVSDLLAKGVPVMSAEVALYGEGEDEREVRNVVLLQIVRDGRDVPLPRGWVYHLDDLPGKVRHGLERIGGEPTREEVDTVTVMVALIDPALLEEGANRFLLKRAIDYGASFLR